MTLAARSILPIGLALVAPTFTAHAAVFGPGDDLPLTGTTSAAEPQLTGTVIEDESLPFTITLASGGQTTGTIQHRVIRSDLDNTLDFYWCITSDSDSDADLSRFRISSFVSDLYKADYRTDGLYDRGFESALRFAGSIDASMNFRFTDLRLAPGERSAFVFLDTRHTEYARTAIMDVLSDPNFPGSSEIFSTFSPVIPAPASVAPLAALLLALPRRRRN
jgi:hypothetical protein